jgi:hypothetical protein
LDSIDAGDPCDEPDNNCRWDPSEFAPLDPEGLGFDCSTLGLYCLTINSNAKAIDDNNPPGGQFGGGDFDGLLGRLSLFDVGDLSGGGNQRFNVSQSLPIGFQYSTDCAAFPMHSGIAKVPYTNIKFGCSYAYACSDDNIYIGGATYGTLVASCGNLRNSCPVLDISATINCNLTNSCIMRNFQINECHSPDILKEP